MNDNKNNPYLYFSNIINIDDDEKILDLGLIMCDVHVINILYIFEKLKIKIKFEENKSNSCLFLFPNSPDPKLIKV